jgi:cytochrome c
MRKNINLGKILGLSAIAAFSFMATTALADGDAKKGEQLFNRCKACHTIEAGGANRVGPNLHGVVGRKSASAAGYAYSDALKAKNIVWTNENLEKWLEKPAAFVPGTKMTFIGLAKEDQREDVIAYLKANSK